MERLDAAYTRHVQEIWPPDEPEALPNLIESGEAVEAILDTPGWALLQRVLGAEADAVAMTVDARPPRKVPEQSEFARALARAGALREVPDAARAITGEATRRRQAAEAKGEQ